VGNDANQGDLYGKGIFYSHHQRRSIGVSEIDPLSQVEPMPTVMCPSCGNMTLVKRYYRKSDGSLFSCLKCGWRRLL
jgi:predicted RNA-binding Zn-ribbon protein involved in translation (DUF1610 family)